MSRIIKPALRLCQLCHWVPADVHDKRVELTMGDVEMHFKVDHDNATVRLDLAAVCICRTTMVLDHSSPTGGGFKDWFRCPVDGNIGFIKRSA